MREIELFVGFMFTEDSVLQLEKQGFHLTPLRPSEDSGYQSYLVLFEGKKSFEIRLIQNESDYTRTQHVEHFEPFQISAKTAEFQIQHPNTVSLLKSKIVLGELKAGEVRSFFSIRKPFPLCALWCECENFSEFQKVAKPDRIFDWDGKQAGLIHLGPNCFDIIVTEKNSIF